MLAHRTPPLHGSGVIGDLVYENFLKYDIKLFYIGLATSTNISDVGQTNFRKLLLLIRIFKQLLSCLIFHKPSIIYITPSMVGLPFYRDFIYALVIKIYRFFVGDCRIIFHLHMRPVNASWIKKKYLFKIFFNKEEIIFLSELLIKDYSTSNFDSSSIHVLPNAIKPLLNKKNAIKNIRNNFSNGNSRRSTVNVLYLGHLIESKGYRRALDIAKNILKNNDEYKFSFVGEYGAADDKKYFQNYILSNNLVDKIAYLGPTTYDEKKINLFLNNDILILPSYSEAYPLTILEALSFGMPVVATKTGAIEEIVSKDFGYIVSDDSNYDNYIEKFSKATLDLEKRWTEKLAISCVENFHDRWSEKIFSSTLYKILHNRSS